ncbi:MAG: hypothetical protein ABL914_10930 [Novosphingobium sp.]|uniref:hypothetical protein n=1 Tax=Novosphingobium sp. TaxID=1874826 RepID=UPI0032BD5252
MIRALESIRRELADYSATFGFSPRELLTDLVLGVLSCLVLAGSVAFLVAGVRS